MKLSKKSRDGYIWAVFEVKKRLSLGWKPENALKAVGLTNWEDMLYFFDYLREMGEKSLLKKLNADKS